jgi:hypothetical protein
MAIPTASTTSASSREVRPRVAPRDSVALVSAVAPLHASRREAWLLWGVVTPILATFFAAAKLLLFVNFRTSYDLRARIGVGGSLARGDGFFNPERGASLLGEHFEPFLVVFTPFFRAGVGAEALLVTQALAGAVTVALAWLLVRDVLRGLPRPQALAGALALTALYAGYRPFLSAVAFDFHATTVAMPLVAGALLALRRGADRALWTLAAALLATRENAGLVLLGLALYAGITLGRQRLAWTLAAVGAASGVLVTTVVMPLFRDVEWHHLERLAPLADPTGKLLYLLQLAGLLLLLPLLAPRTLLAAAPTTALNLAVDFENQYSGAFHYDDQNSLFWLVAAAHGALVAAPKLGAWWHGGPERRRRVVGRIARTAAVAALVVGTTLGARTLQPLLATPAERDLRQRLRPYLALADEVPIAADGVLAAHFAHRRGYLALQRLAEPSTPRGTLVLVAGEALGRTLSERQRRAWARAYPDCEPVERGPTLEVFRYAAPHAAAKGR